MFVHQLFVNKVTGGCNIKSYSLFVTLLRIINCCTCYCCYYYALALRNLSHNHFIINHIPPINPLAIYSTLCCHPTLTSVIKIKSTKHYSMREIKQSKTNKTKEKKQWKFCYIVANNWLFKYYYQWINLSDLEKF